MGQRFESLKGLAEAAQIARDLDLGESHRFVLRNEAIASLVLPDGLGGTALLVYDNFRVIKKWNNSNYFAAAVGYIADSIDRG